jgi:8-oxo-dGTP pyrophosphatase MutT (NUDIX family)
MTLPISQIEYVTYTRCLNEIKAIEQCNRKNEIGRIGLLEGRFVKLASSRGSINSCQTIFEWFTASELNALKGKISFINDIHSKLKCGKLKERNSDDCTPLAAEFYNTSIKTISAWNSVFTNDGLLIDLPADQSSKLEPSFIDKTSSQKADEKALARYFQLLDGHPKLRREGELNDYTKGTYQIIYDPKIISEIRQEIYQRLYSKAKAQNLSDSDAEELATNFSRPGVVCEDQFWLWIRDVVISPQGFKHTYNRLVWKSDLGNTGGAAALPIITDNEGNKRYIVQLAFRHATSSWEFEMPRGGSKPNETPLDTAKREIEEETGCETDHLMALGSITPDSGLTATVVPIFLGQVTLEKAAKQDKTEAIKGKYSFTFVELMEGLKRGYIEVEINEKPTQVPIRDPFLTYALLMAQYNMQL